MKAEEMENHVEGALAALHRAQEVARKRSIEFGTPFVVDEKVSYEANSPTLEASAVREETAED